MSHPDVIMSEMTGRSEVENLRREVQTLRDEVARLTTLAERILDRSDEPDERRPSADPQPQRAAG